MPETPDDYLAANPYTAEGETPADSRSSTELLADAPAEEAILSLGGSSEITELAELADAEDDPAVTPA